MATVQPSGERRIFEMNQDDECPECQTYLEELGTERNPFKCPYLRVLPVDMAVKRYHDGGPPHRYQSGDLICIERARAHVSRRCGGLRELTLNPNGDLEAECEWPLKGKIAIKIHDSTVRES